MTSHHATLVVIALLALPARTAAAQNPQAFVRLRIGVTCDRGQNFQVFLRNTHSGRDINATVQSRVAGGPFSRNSYRVVAGDERQIGCASDARIVGAFFLTPPGGTAGGERVAPGEGSAMKFAVISFGRACDTFGNREVFLTNRHTQSRINITIRWRVTNGADQFTSFLMQPRGRQKVGCANQARVTGARWG